MACWPCRPSLLERAGSAAGSPRKADKTVTGPGGAGFPQVTPSTRPSLAGRPRATDRSEARQPSSIGSAGQEARGASGTAYPGASIAVRVKKPRSTRPPHSHCRNVGDVATPAGVGRGGVHVEVAADQVRAGGRCRIRDGRALEAAWAPSAQPASAHQPGHTLAAVPVAAAAPVGVNAWGAVAALGRLVGRSDVLGELLVDALAGCDVGGAVGVVGGPGDLQQLARTLDGALLGSLRLDEPIDVHRVSFAKNAVARLRISTSHAAAGSPAAGLPAPGVRCWSARRRVGSRRPVRPGAPTPEPRSRSDRRASC